MDFKIYINHAYEGCEKESHFDDSRDDQSFNYARRYQTFVEYNSNIIIDSPRNFKGQFLTRNASDLQKERWYL